MAEKMYAAGKYPEAVVYYRSADRHVPDSGEARARYRMALLSDMSYAYLRMGRAEDAIKCLDEGMALAKANGTKDALVGLLDVLCYIQQEAGMTAEAERTHVEYLIRQEELANDSKVISGNDELLLAELQRTTQQAQYEARHRHRLAVSLVAAVGVLILGTLVLIFAVRRYRQEKRTNRLLYEKNEQLLSQQNEMRKRIETKEEGNGRTIPDKHKGTTHVQPKKHSEEAVLEEIWHGIQTVMETSDEIYHHDFSLQKLSELTGTKPRYATVAISRHYPNFYTMLNTCRINEACRRLHDPRYANLTIEALAQSLGFKSRSNFVATFKKLTGLSPSQYQKMTEGE